MTTKIALVANLSLQVFQQHALRALTTNNQSLLNQSPSAYIGNPSMSGLNSLEQLLKKITFQSSQNKTSSPGHENLLEKDLRRLIMTLRNLTAQDVGFNQKWISDTSAYAAPVVYVHIMENEIFSMGIFVLRPGSRIPLHDHPGMFGILRVLYGSLRCRSFTRLDEARAIYPGSPLSNALSPLTTSASSRWQLTDLVVAQLHQDTILSVDSDPCLLTPAEGNLHELTVCDEAAVFLDILAPPYDHDLGTRECRFYKEVILPQSVFISSGAGDNYGSINLQPAAQEENDQPSNGISSSEVEGGSQNGNNFRHNITAQTSSEASRTPLVYMIETHQPKDYWCESAEYVGPSVI